MRARRAASSSGENLLKSGAIRRGHAQVTSSEKHEPCKPRDDPPGRAGPGHDPEHDRRDGTAQEQPECPALQQVGDEYVAGRCG